MKVVFLDIDGVLNSAEYVHKIKELFDNPSNQIDPNAVVLLNKITDQTGAVIVVSSSWRLSFPNNLEGMSNCLKEQGVTGKVIGMTPIMHATRAAEIIDWLYDYKPNGEKVERFIILDDDRLGPANDDTWFLDDQLIKTTWDKGLQECHVEKALRLLGAPIGQSVPEEAERRSPEEIVKILHSISKLSVEDNELDTWFQNDQTPSGIRGFVPNSFTRRLLEFLEDYLLENKE